MPRPIQMLQYLKKYLQSIDLSLLFFLLMMTNVSQVIKLMGLVFIFIVRPNFRLGLNKNRIPLFYAAMLGLVAFQTIISCTHWQTNYWLVMLLSFGFWGLSLLAIHQLKLATERSNSDQLNKTLNIFFILNAVVSFVSLIKIMLITQSINPYSYTGMNLNYHMSTGDHIRGIFNDLSTTNCCINILGLIYYLFNKKYNYALLCLIVVLLTTSNLNTAIMLLALGLLFIYQSNKLTQSIIVCFLGIIVVFFIKVTPENIRYVAGKIGMKYEVQVAQIEPIINNPILNSRDSIILNDERIVFERMNQKIKTKEAQKQILAQSQERLFTQQHNERLYHFQSFAHKTYGNQLLVDAPKISKPYSGKTLAFIETKQFLARDPINLLLGAGPGNFSSKIAFKASGIEIVGRYPKAYQYINDLFKNNHLEILCYYMSQEAGMHSTTNMPFSVYNQLLGEYGLIGFTLFIICYILYFLKKWKKLRYGRILLPIVLLFFISDFWFENLSLVLVFELLIFMDIARSAQTQANDAQIA
jgi:hypothetical protein